MGLGELVRKGTGGNMGARLCRVPRAVVRSSDFTAGVLGSLGGC